MDTFIFYLFWVYLFENEFFDGLIKVNKKANNCANNHWLMLTKV